MTVFKYIFLISSIIFLGTLIAPEKLQAEIATTQDWVGVFTIGTTGNTKSATTGGNNWKYTSSCTQTPGTTPKLEDAGCSFSPLPLGAFELRLYANDKESSDALIANSKTFWIPFSLNTPLATDCTVTTNAQSQRTLSTTLKWPSLIGLESVKANRSGANRDQSFNLACNAGVCPTTYTDTITSAGGNNTIYEYSLTAYNSNDSRNSDNNLRVTITGDNSCTITSFVVSQPPTPTVTPTPTGGPDVGCPGSGLENYSKRIDIVDVGDSHGNLFSSVDVNPNATNKYSINTKCLLGTRAYFSQAAMPNYSQLKSDYYDNTGLPSGPVHDFTSGTSVDTAISDILATFSNENPIGTSPNETYYHLIRILGNSDLNSTLSIPAKHVFVVFVDGNLTIKQAISDTNSSGIAFVVGGDVRIVPWGAVGSVNEIDSFIVVHNQFCSAWNESNEICPLTTTVTPQLLINGSVIFLNNPSSGTPPGKPRFARSLTDNTTLPAEKIIYQPKYLILLRSILASNLTIWSEIQ